MISSIAPQVYRLLRKMVGGKVDKKGLAKLVTLQEGDLLRVNCGDFRLVLETAPFIGYRSISEYSSV